VTCDEEEKLSVTQLLEYLFLFLRLLQRKAAVHHQQSIWETFIWILSAGWKQVYITLIRKQTELVSVKYKGTGLAEMRPGSIKEV
jgi:hypothetical protein